MKKELIFNYFVKKCIDKKYALLGVNFKEAMLGMILSHTSLIRRYAQGVSMEEIYLTNRYYFEELFLILCLDAKKHGQDIISKFNFQYTNRYRQSAMFVDHIEDTDLDKYLESILPTVKNKKEVDFSLYENVTSLSAEDLLKKSYRLDNLCKVAIDELELPDPSEETAVIDNAWERLMANADFVELVERENKHTPQAQSIAVCYLEQHYAEELKRYIS